MKTSRIRILNTPIDAVNMQQTLQVIDHAINRNQNIQHVVVNAAKLVKMQKNQELFDSVVNSTLINADGQGVVWASKILRKPLPERVAGIDLMQHLFVLAKEKKYKIYLLGAKEDIINQTAETISNNYSSEILAGWRNGYFSVEEEESVAKIIAKSGAHMLFVGMPSPKKEIFLNKYKKLLNMPFIMGVGGSFDVLSGKVKRAPLWMQKIGLEWFYRFLQEPQRMWKRYLITNSLFIWYVLRERFGKPVVPIFLSISKHKTGH